MQRSRRSLALRLACAALAMAWAGCGPVGPDSSIATSEEGETCEPYSAGGYGYRLDTNRAVDVLFVIDNSGSMGPHQLKLNLGAAALFEQLDAGELDYRIGFTTTDNGNIWCPVGQTTPEGGKLVMSPCTERLDDFIYNNGAVDVQQLACLERCPLDADALEITPTRTAFDPTPAPRPWLQRVRGQTNLPEGTDPLAAFECFAPQGVNGCGFESPLESLYLALIRAQDDAQASYGFLRSSAVLAIVLVSDELDCSLNKDWSEIFEQDGNRVFWSDPNADFPSSAVCWNAGVSCSGNPGAYDHCAATDFDAQGNPTANEAEAVLHPLSRYAGLLAGLEADKQQLDPEQELLFMAITGVEGNGEAATLSYAEAEDPEYQDAFGIGPGCTGADGLSALPPVRMRELSEQMGPAGLFSACAPDYSQAMDALGQAINEQMRPACFGACIADGDPTTPQLEANCRVLMDPPGSAEPLSLRPCLREAGAYQLDPETGEPAIPEGEDLCYLPLIDREGELNEDPLDDMSSACREPGYNLEFEFVRRPGWVEPPGTYFEANCTLSGCPELDCPELFR